MSTPLERLVARARVAQHGVGLRIEPLLGPLFAKPAEAGRTLEESDLEVGAPARMPAASSRSLHHSGHRPTSVPLADSSREGELASVASLPEDASRTAPEAGAAATYESAADQPARNLSDRVLKEPAYERAQRTDVLQQAATRATPERTPSNPIQQPNPVATAKWQRDPPAPAKPQPDSMAPIEVTPTITISIGHVEIRNASMPAPAAQRRPSFRPSTSLNAFLQRGKGDER